MPSATEGHPLALAEPNELWESFDVDRQWHALAAGAYDDRPADRLDALLSAALVTRRSARRTARPAPAT
jgi:hypothetical protein